MREQVTVRVRTDSQGVVAARSGSLSPVDMEFDPIEAGFGLGCDLGTTYTQLTSARL